MKKEQVANDWRRALKAREAAETLLAAKLYDDAVSRAYYAVLHAARAALIAQGVVPKTHAGVRRLFGQKLVEIGEIEREWAKVLARIQDRREDADYDTATTLEMEPAQELVDEARRFVDRMADHLDSKGVAPNDDATER